MYLLALPDDVLEKILSYMSYDEVSRCRLVSQRFNEVAKRVLNHGFHKVEKYHSQCLKHVKSQLPRRESERRNHPLARHCDILTAVETRLSLLRMTFKKFIDLNFCCFIPGKVLDEIYKVLRYVTTEQSPIRAHEVLQELRDLSSMAMEYFDEKISPGLKKHKETGPKINILCTSINHLRPSAPHHPKESRIFKMVQYLNELAKRQNNLSTEVAALQRKKNEHDNIGKKIADLEQFATESKKRLSESEKVIDELQSTVKQQAIQIREQELKIEKMSKLIAGKQPETCPNDSSSKNFRTNNRKKRQLTVSKIKNTSCSLRSSKRKFVPDVSGGKSEVVKKMRRKSKLNV